MIGGIIVLGLFLTALAAMIFVSRQFDTYQSTVNTMQQKDIDRFSENLVAIPSRDGISKGNLFSIPCPGGLCNNYTLRISNLGIGAQIARIYINSSKSDQPSCTYCVFDSAGSAQPMRFQVSDQYVNAGEISHNVTLWLPGNPGPNDITLPQTCYIKGVLTLCAGANSISIITTRGRIFSFYWPFPATGPGSSGAPGGQGATGLYIGPLVITFNQSLITYSTSSINPPPVPNGGKNGIWAVPTGNLIVYVKIQTDRGTPTDVYLTAQSVLEMAQFNSPGVVRSFFVIAPITQNLCTNVFQAYDPSVDCSSSTSNDLTKFNGGDPSKIVGYPFCPLPATQYNNPSCNAYGTRIRIPAPTSQQILNNQRGSPVIVAFAATTPSGSNGQSIPGGGGGGWQGSYITTFLGLTYVFDAFTGGGPYFYGVTLPFVALCVSNTPQSTSGCGI
jgi:hypothetical protein